MGVLQKKAARSSALSLLFPPLHSKVERFRKQQAWRVCAVGMVMSFITVPGAIRAGSGSANSEEEGLLSWLVVHL